jgi:hypothetical protein
MDLRSILRHYTISNRVILRATSTLNLRSNRVTCGNSREHTYDRSRCIFLICKCSNLFPPTKKHNDGKQSFPCHVRQR